MKNFIHKLALGSLFLLSNQVQWDAIGQSLPDLTPVALQAANLTQVTLTNLVDCPGPYPESGHPYGNNADSSWTNRYTGAQVLVVSFDPRCAGEGTVDKLYIMDGDGNQIDGSPFGLGDLAGQTKMVWGDTVRLRFTSDGSVTGWGFAIAKIQQGKLVQPPVLTATPQDRVQVSWEVANQGGGTAQPSWTDQLYLSTSVQWDSRAVAVGSAFSWNSALAVGNSYTRSTVINLPNVATGNYYLILRSDAAGNLAESNEANNTRAMPITLVIPDLAPVALQAANLTQVTLTNLVDCPGPYPESGHPYGNNADSSWTNRYPGAQVLVVSFDPRCAGEGTVDKLYLMDGNGNQIDGSPFGLGDLAGQTKMVMGDTLRLRFTSDGSVTGWGFAVNKIQRGQVIQPVVLTAAPQDRLGVSWEVANQGSGAAQPPWSDQLYLSTNAVWDARAIPIGPALSWGSTLGAGSSYTRSTLINLPAVAIGNYYLILRTDAGGNLAESNEANNTRAIPINLVLPDLEPVGLQGVNLTEVALTNLVDGPGPYPETSHPYANNVDLTWTNRYAGAQALLVTFDARCAGEGTTDKLYLMDGNGTQIDGSPFGLGALAGQTKMVLGDTLRLRFTSDASVTGWGLAISKIQAGQVVRPAVLTAAPDDWVQVSWEVANHGSADAWPSWSDQLYLSANAVWDDLAIVTGSAMSWNSVLGAGNSYQRSLVVNLPDVVAGNYYLILKTDAGGNLVESSEANNTRAVPVMVALPDSPPVGLPELRLGQVTPDSIDHSWGYRLYCLPATNSQHITIQLKGDEYHATNALYVRFGNLPSRTTFDFAAKEAGRSSQVVEISNATAGWYYVLVCGNGPGSSGDPYRLFLPYFPNTSGQAGLNPITLSISDPRANQTVSSNVVTVSGLINLSQKKAIDLMLVADTSGSLQDNDRQDFRKRAMVALLHAIPTNADVRVGLVDFDDTAKLLSPLTNNLASVEQKVRTLDQNGGTAMDLGIEAARREFTNHGRTNAEWFIILFSDGESQSDPFPAAVDANAQGIRIHSIFLGSQTTQGAAAMQDVARATYGVFLYATNPQDLIDAFSRVSSAASIDRIEVTSDAMPGVTNRATIAANFWNAGGVAIRSSPGAVTEIRATAYTTENPPRTALDSVRVYYLRTDQPPVITRQPQSQTNLVGSSAVFSVEAVGTAPIGYQWRHEGSAMPGETNATLTLPKLEAGVGYTVLAKAIDDTGVFSPWSETATFVAGNGTGLVITAPGQPVGIDSGASSVTLSWPPSTDTLGNPLHYGVQYRSGLDAAHPWQLYGETTNTSIVLTNLQAGTGYTVIVKGIDSTELFSPWSQTNTVWPGPRVMSAPSQLAASGISGTSATISWGASVDTWGHPLHYEVQYRLGLDATAPWLFYGDTTSTSIVLTNLEAGVTYTVIAKGIGDTGAFSPWSETAPFVAGSGTGLVITAPGQPVGIDSGPSSVTLSWPPSTDTLGNPLHYEVQYRSGLDAAHPWQLYGETTNRSIVLTNLQAGTGYAVIVKGIDTTGLFSPWSQANTVWAGPRVISAPRQLAASGISGTSATISWGASVDTWGHALHYEVQYQDGLDPTHTWLLYGETTNTSIVLPNLQSNQAGLYAVEVSNPAGFVVSSNALLTVWQPPVITRQPLSRTNVVGDTVEFSVEVTGTPPVAYQWWHAGDPNNGEAVAGETNAKLTMTNAQPSQDGLYWVVITNSAGSVTSSTARLMLAVTITRQPESRTNVVGSTAVFSVQAVGSPPINYQWWGQDGQALPGQTASVLTLTNVQVSDAGLYGVAVANPANFIASSNATLTVWEPIRILQQPASQTNRLGSTVAFSVVAVGTSPITYQWRHGAIPLANQTNATLTLPNIQASDAGSYAAELRNPVGPLTSSNAALIVTQIAPPVILVPPQSQASMVGQKVSFSVVADGSLPLSYQWRFNGQDLAWATNTLLEISSVQLTNYGYYTVWVTNVAGSVLSPAAVLGRPAILQGQVTDALNGLPLGRVLVSGGGQSASTDPQGNYRLTNLLAGLLTANFDADVFSGKAPLTVHFRNLSTTNALTITGSKTNYATYRNHEVRIVPGFTNTLSFSLSPVLSQGMRAVLNWAAKPADLDLHLQIEGTTNVVDYNHKVTAYGRLDHDVTTGFGPETLTVDQFFPGLYHYYVQHYDVFMPGPRLAESAAQVHLYRGAEELNVISVTKMGSGAYWHVCTVDGDTGAIRIINQITDSAALPTGAESGGGAAGSGASSGLAFLWDFGDGTTSTNENPVKVYGQAGSYGVSLRVEGENGQHDVAVRPGFVVVSGETPRLVAGISLDGSNVVIAFTGASGQIYTVESKDSLTDAYSTWQTRVVLTNGADGVLQALDAGATASVTNRFYRIKRALDGEVVSDPAGFWRMVLSPGANAISVPLHPPATARGLVTAVNGQTVTLSGKQSWSVDALAPTNSFSQYILLVRRAAAGNAGVEGDWWTIAANTGNAITLDPGIDTLSASLVAGDQIEVRRLTSMRDLFGQSANLLLSKDHDGSASAGDYSKADVIRFLAGTSFGPPVFYHDGTLLPEGWYIGSTGPLDGSTITLLPGQAIMVFRPADSSPTNLIVTGQVQVGPLTRYLQPGPNVIGSPFAGSSPIATSNLKESGWHPDSTGAAAGGDYSQADVIRPLAGTSFGPPVFYHDGTLLPAGWYSGSTLNNTFALQPSRAYVFFVSGTKTIHWCQTAPYTP